MRVIEDLLIGNYKIIQDTDYYRVTSYAVLLSRFLTAKRGETVADFCSGSGIVGLHFYAENKGISSVTLFEMQQELADMSRESVELNGLGGVFKVENVRLQEIPARYCEKFSLILCNPPYERGGFENADPKKALCRKELSLTLGELCEAAKKCLKFGGRFALVHRADRLAEVLYTLHGCGLEPKKIQLVAGRAGAKPYLARISAVKGGTAGVEVLPMAVNSQEWEV
ncbi:MAG: methyltransferase [Clostridia bacterium]|nr:methyltransferase [Clostridia bacterium]